MSQTRLDLKAREIVKGLALDSAGTREVVEERLGELNYDELRTLLVVYGVSLAELGEKIWRCEGLRRKKSLFFS